jgi:aminoglycoside phosphotransferase (APT) family kinase protein
VSSSREPVARPTTAVFEGALPDLRATVSLVLDGTAPGNGLQTARAAGALLRRIHDLPSQGLEERTAQDTLDSARRAARVLCAVDPAAESQVERVLARLTETMPSGGAMVTSHGDFHSGELIRRDGELAVVAVDEACRAQPARDLATYAARATAHEGADPDAVVEGLLAGYGDGEPDGLRWYLSASLLRRAERPFRSLEEDWPAHVEELVTAAERALDG